MGVIEGQLMCTGELCAAAHSPVNGFVCHNVAETEFHMQSTLGAVVQSFVILALCSTGRAFGQEIVDPGEFAPPGDVLLQDAPAQVPPVPEPMLQEPVESAAEPLMVPQACDPFGAMPQMMCPPMAMQIPPAMPYGAACPSMVPMSTTGGMCCIPPIQTTSGWCPPPVQFGSAWCPGTQGFQTATYPAPVDLSYAPFVAGYPYATAPVYANSPSSKHRPHPLRADSLLHCSPGNMFPIGPISPVARGSYYFRPYNFRQVQLDQMRAAMWTGNTAAPYTSPLLPELAAKLETYKDSLDRAMLPALGNPNVMQPGVLSPLSPR